MFGRNETLAIRTIFQEVLYDVINGDAYKKESWEVEVVANLWVDIPMVSIVGLIPSNVVHYVRQSIRYKQQMKL